MIKKKSYLLMLLSLYSLTATAQFTVGATVLHISAGTQVNISNATIQPATDLNISNNKISLDHTPVPGVPNASVMRVYEWEQPIEMDGTIGLFVQAAELNGNDFSNLQVAYSDTSGNSNFTIAVSGSTIDSIGYVFLPLPGPTTIKQITATEYGVVLPVAWLSFTAIAKDGTAVLDWKVAAEKEVNLYTVQHSSDGAVYTDIAPVLPKCINCNAAVAYQYCHPEPLAGANFYRIKQSRIDGGVAYTETRRLYFGHEGAMTVSPNPARAYIRVSGLTTESLHLRVNDNKGRTIYSHALTGMSHHRVDVAGWQPGTYFVNVSNKHGDTETFKLVKL